MFQTIMKQILAFLAAGTVVLTGVYIVILWRNQSPTSVLQREAGTVIYATPSMALGVLPGPHHSERVTLLRYSGDAGWVIAGSGHWLGVPGWHREDADVSIMPNLTNGPLEAYWLCAVQKNPRITAIRVWDPHDPKRTQEFTFHKGGIIEPITFQTGMEVATLIGAKTVSEMMPTDQQVSEAWTRSR